jgi:hypothetical protein
MTSENTTPRSAHGPLSPESLVDGPWFGKVKEACATRKGARIPRWLFPLGGLLIAGLLFTLGGRWRTVAYIGAGLVLGMVVLEALNPNAAAAIHRGLAKFGQWLGKIVGWIFLVPAYLIVGPVARLLTRVTGPDPLALRAGNNPSFWAWADTEKRRAGQAARMFCAERVAGGRNWLAALLVLGLIGFLAGELVLRFYFGYHNPVLYQSDSHCGFRLRPDQDVVTPRGHVQINNFSMRYHRDVTKEKPAGVFRILMIGDSTLFGGEYLTNSETYAGLVEDRLNARYNAGGQKYEVLPIGTNGWGPQHQLGWVEKFGTFNADLTLVTTPAADVDRPKILVDGTRYMTVKPVLAWQTMFTWACWEGRHWLGTSGGNYYPDEAESMMMIREGVRAFVDLGKLVRKSCPQVMFECLPQISSYGQAALEGRFEENSRYKALLDMLLPDLKAAGFDMTYPITLFKGWKPEDQLFHDGAHLDKKGHDLYADYLISRIVEVSPGFRKYAGLPEPAPAAAAPARP